MSKVETEQGTSSGPSQQPEYRVVRCKPFMACTFEIQVRKRFLFWSYWKSRGLCTTLTEAKQIIGYYQSQPREGTVLFVS